MQFQEIPGLQEVKDQLIQAFNNKKIAHAQLFHGYEGGAQLAVALAYAAYLLCEQPEAGDSCGHCSACSKSHRFIHPDLHFSFPISGNKGIATKDAHCNLFLEEWRQFLTEQPFGNINTWKMYFGKESNLTIVRNESRKIIEKLSLKPMEGPRKILLLWLPEYFNKEAGNAILKIIEEPAPGTVFLVVTEDREKILKTILSRLQPVSIRPFEPEELMPYLEKKGISRAREVAHIVDGNLFEALQYNGEADTSSRQWFRDWMRRCYEHHYLEMNDLSDHFHKMSKVEQSGVLKYGLHVLREALILHAGEQTLSRAEEEERQFIQRFGKLLSIDQIEAMNQQFNQAIYQLERNLYGRLLFMNLSLDMAQILRPQ